MNSLKSAHVNSQKYLSEHESQRKHLEARLQHEMEGHQRYVQTLQGQIQYHSSRAQGLQHSLDSLSAQQQVKIVVCTSGVFGDRKTSFRYFSIRPPKKTKVLLLHGTDLFLV